MKVSSAAGQRRGSASISQEWTSGGPLGLLRTRVTGALTSRDPTMHTMYTHWV
ncbi:hypothetical protein [Streptomyces sp. SM11]|uniref:hypothetical protein n=1 Tax=Streptomyces sp. SM11 TaxID=565557 RepID=UPI0015E168F5|nr:hypothetical protein [Streptomyces sp. SM11]